ncbi:LolA-like outer membrane lipoprotein chaperone [Hydrogenimonas sp. SS33]|uniref:LolA-like outer membrane lipoprotein chaperone n=1 Tax=Hydrogenimonas leucolamina TaxID=2954236 RepID=UPI00336C0B84
MTSVWAGLPVPAQMQADFNQSIINKENNETIRYEGHFALKVPGMAKWVYTRPLSKTICLDNDRAWVIEPELEQATLYRLNRAIPLVAILKKAKRIAPGRYEAKYEGVDYDITVDDKGRPLTLSYRDELGNRVLMRFSNLNTAPFDPALLKCDIPDGFDIIDGRL